MNLGYLFAAFALIWTLIFGYMVSVASRQKQIEAQLELLTEWVAADREPPGYSSLRREAHR